MRKFLFVLVTAFGISTFGSLAQAGEGCSHIKATDGKPLISPSIKTTDVAPAEAPVILPVDSTKTPG